MSRYELLSTPTGFPIKAWTKGVAFDENAKKQVFNMAQLPFIHRWIAIMPDVHVGKGATIGSVIPTLKAIIPAAVGVDLGCGMMAVKTSLFAADLPDSLLPLRSEIEKNIPHGRSQGRGRDKGSWGDIPQDAQSAWLGLQAGFDRLCQKHPFLKNTNHLNHLGTLGSGNHFIELCLDEHQGVWVMLHSGSRGVGNRIGTHFIEVAKKEMGKNNIHLPDQDLAYLCEGSQHFDHYVAAVAWAQDFARVNREVMMSRVLSTLSGVLHRSFDARLEAVNCHHNYIRLEKHQGETVWITRKGAVSAQKGEMGIIPGSMGANLLLCGVLGI